MKEKSVFPAIGLFDFFVLI